MNKEKTPVCYIVAPNVRCVLAHFLGQEPCEKVCKLREMNRDKIPDILRQIDDRGKR